MNRLPSITLQGDAEFAALLRELPGTLFKETRQVLQDAGTRIAKRARTKLRKNHGLDTGQLRKSLGVRKIIAYPREGRMVMYIGPRRKYLILRKNNSKHDPFYIAHFVEFGHRIVTEEQGKLAKSSYKAKPDFLKGENQGFVHDKEVQPRPFLRPAVDESKSEFNAMMAAKLKKIIERSKAKK